ncbi:MAG: acetate--CoA ligase family protein [Gammaproteobacteria bacterium]|nr:acetate--CoA ligase family protein [Gammaproteobacteria bacterium]MCW5583259.1 acetate--CoA ligase family protein [Gammaproteobacteria bacterium]
MTHYLARLFQPSSIAVIGASDRSNAVGMKVFKNLLQENFTGKIYAVNPKHEQVQGQLCVSSVNKIHGTIDLAVITTPAKTVPDILEECGKKNIQAAIVISSGFSETGEDGKKLEDSLIKIAHQYHIRLIGPNCLGVMRPHLRMNATFDNNVALPDGLALVSQSGAISAAILDWAMNKKIGFSALISLGNSADVDFGDVLDYLAMDPQTKSILLYIEGIKNARKLMNGLRAAARTKPVIAIKGGRKLQGSRAALSHTGAIIGSDDVFDAALKRAGVVRVMTIEELFSAAEILSSDYPQVKGNRLIIITNGGGAGVMAADQASELNITLPALSEKTTCDLNEVLPAQWSHQNPVDIIGDATPARYHMALDICAKEDVDGILTILVPVAMSNPMQVAKQVIQDVKQHNKLILACWMGEKQVKSSWDLFDDHRIPCFDTPEKAVSAFSYLADYYHNQQLLLQAPEFSLLQPRPDLEITRSIIETALNEGRTVLTTIESKKILKSFFIPISEPQIANTKDEAIAIAKLIGFPVAMKIYSPDISHKQEAGGVELNVTNEAMVGEIFEKIIHRAKKIYPRAIVLGVTLEPMLKSSNDRELMIGVMSDKVLGPVISFGAGGTFVEVMQDRALALPPLNPFIAEHLIDQTRIAKALGKFRNMPAIHLNEIINILLRVSEMVCAFPSLQEMDLNPIIVNEKNAVAVDARIVVAPVLSLAPYDHLAIHP